MIRIATTYVPIDDDRTLLDDCGCIGIRPAVRLDGKFDFNFESWMSTDPVGMADGLNVFDDVGNDPDNDVDPALLDDPACDGMNFYAYCADDPCNDVDPTGFDVADLGVTQLYKGKEFDPLLFQHCGPARWFNPEVGKLLHDSVD